MDEYMNNDKSKATCTCFEVNARFNIVHPSIVHPKLQLLPKSRLQNYSTPQGCVFSTLCSLCCNDLLQTGGIVCHKLLAALLGNFGPFLVGNGLQCRSAMFLGLRAATASFRSHQIFLIGLSLETVMATQEPSSLFSLTKPLWIWMRAWGHCLAGMSNDAQASISSRTGWHSWPEYPGTWLNPWCLQHGGDSQCHSKQNIPTSSHTHHHASR